MKKLFVSIAAMTMLLATGCQNEELVQQGNSGDYTLTLDMGAQSRTMHDENGDCVWGENEAIYVVGEGGKVFGTLTMKSKSEDGKKAVFSGKVTGDPAKLQFMVYPVPEADGTIPMGNIDGTNHNAPMTGSISGGVVEGVDYAGGLVKVPVSGVDDIKVSAENGDGEVLTGGSYTFNPVTGELEFDPNGGTPVTITNVSETNGFVYVPVETEVEDNSETSEEETEEVTVTVTIGEGEEKVEQSFETEIQEGAITTNGIPSFDVDEESGAVNLSVADAAQLRAALASGGNIELTANIEIGETAMTIAADKEVNLNLKGFAVKEGKIICDGILTIMTDSIGIENVCNFSIEGSKGTVTLMGGVYNDTALNLMEGYAYVTYNDVHVVLPNKEYTIVGNTSELTTAVAGGETNLYLLDGEYNINECGKKTLTFSGSKNAVIHPYNEGEGGCDYGLDGSTVTFNDVTIGTEKNTGWERGYGRCNATYNRCVIYGEYSLYGTSVFNECVLNISGDHYNIRTWGAPTATFTDCTFNCDGKAMLLYGTADTKLTMNGCTFNDNGGLADLKAAIEIGNNYNKSYELIVNNATVNGFEINDKGINTGTTLWANKNSMGTDKLNVVIDGVDVY